MNINCVVSLHFHPGLKSEIKLYLERYKAHFYGDFKYGFNDKNKSIKELLCSNQTFIFYNTAVGNLFFLLLRLFFKNVKIIYCFHEPVLPLSLKNSFSDNIKCFVVNVIHSVFFIFSNKIIVFSEYGKEKIPNAFNGKIEIQKLPFDITDLINYRPSNYTLTKRSNILKILFYGNLNSGKNPTQFIEFFKNYKGNNYRLIIVTSSESYYKYLSELNSCYIESIFKKDLSDLDIVNLILSTDIILLPHRRCTQSAIFEKSTYLGKPVFFGPCKGFLEHNLIYGISFGLNELDFHLSLERMYKEYDIFKMNCLKRHLTH
jgi:hypothetical protein